MARKKNKVNLAAKCREANMPYNVVHARINALGWDMDKALTAPVREKTTPSVVKSPDVQRSTTLPVSEELITAQMNEAADVINDATALLQARDAEIEDIQRRLRFWQLIALSVALVAALVSYV